MMTRNRVLAAVSRTVPLLVVVLVATVAWAQGLGANGQAEPDRTAVRTRAILARLDTPIKMPFVQPTPLLDVLNYISFATVSPTFPDGIPMYIDVIALRTARKTNPELSIKYSEARVPLKQAITDILKPLGLKYTVKDGLLLIDRLE